MHLGRRPATLILGPEVRIIVPIARSLGRRRVPVIAANWLRDVATPHSRSIVGYRKLPNPSAGYAAFAASLRDLVLSEGIDWVIPTTDLALDCLAGCAQDLRSVAMVACPPAEAVDLVLDKHATLAAAEQCGIPVPRTYRAAEAVAQLARVRFPVIAKGSDKRIPADFKVRYYGTAAALTNAIESDPRFGEKHLIQEYAPGVGVGVEVLMWDGDPVVVSQHRRLKENPSFGGVSVVAVSESPDATLKEMAVRLLRRIGWSGPAMVEFRCDPTTGAVCLMEVNGRYWGSIALSIRSGVDFPGLAWDLAHGIRPEQPVCRVGVKARWTAGLILRQANLLHDMNGFPQPSFWRDLPGAAVDLCGGAHDMLWTWRDPLPALIEAASASRWLLDPRAILRRTNVCNAKTRILRGRTGLG